MHKEVNPAVFAIVTFPFLFGVMFGDLGHGFLLFFVGMLLCMMNGKLKSNLAMEGFLSMRYMLLLMGFFAMFNGLIYNEFFAIPLHIFGDSCYEQEVKVLTMQKSPSDAAAMDLINKFGYAAVDPASKCVYPFGFDPRWAQTDQFLTFTNNFKMKLAVILGVFQMSIGIVLKGLNALHFRQRLDFLFEFIPQICLLLALFGWMDVLIIAKWLEPKQIN